MSRRSLLTLLLACLAWNRYSVVETLAETGPENEPETDGTCPEGDASCEAGEKAVTCFEADQCPLERRFYNAKSGSAQAYKPNAPEKSVVCDDKVNKRYRQATWPFSKSSIRRKAPKLKIKMNIDTCDPKSCCCSSIEDKVSVEVWQTKPDGSYSALSPGEEEGVCRATVPVEQSAASFETVAPGSTGVFGGLGPVGIDHFPYGPPAIQMLVSTDYAEPRLVQLPILLSKDLEPTSFFGPDWRGPAYNLPRQRGLTIDSWSANVEANEISIEATVHLLQSGSISTLEDTMCQSSVYGTPSSFFVEPISVCAPSLLSFFSI